MTLQFRGARKFAKTLRQRVSASRFLRHVGVLTAANGLGAALSFIQGMVVARWLGPELYGVAALVMTVPAVVYAFFDARSSEASVKYLSEFHARGERDRVLAMCKLGYAVDLAIAASTFLVVVATVRWTASSVIHRPEVVGLILVYAAAFVPRAFVGTSYAVLATLGRFPLVALIDTVTTVLRVGLVLGLVLAGWQVAGVVWGNAVAIVAGGLLYGATALVLTQQTWKASWLRGNWQTLKGQRRGIFWFLVYNDLNALVSMIPKQLDVVILGYVRNPTEVGFYKLAKSLAATVSYLVGPLQSVTYPDLVRLWGVGDRLMFWRKVKRLAWQVGVPLGLVVLMGTAFVPRIVSALAGRAYAPSIVATQVLLVGSAVWLTFFWLRPVYLAVVRVRQWSAGIAIYSVSFICLAALTVPSWGANGVVLSLLAVTILFHLFMGALLRGA